MAKLIFSVDGGNTWVEAEGILVSVPDQYVPGEDGTGDLNFNFTQEGLITDVWMNEGVEPSNPGTDSEMYDEIIERLVNEQCRWSSEDD